MDSHNPHDFDAGVAAVSPTLARDSRDRLWGEVWDRPGLDRRDRGLITIAALIARGQTAALPRYLAGALDDGLTAAEISEAISHLAYYAGWENAMAAIGPVGDLFAARGIGADRLPDADDIPLPLDEAAEATRAASVDGNFGAVAPALIAYTTDFLFRDLWLRPGLAPRDRSLVTVAALVAAGQTAQIGYHLDRAMTNGLTRDQAAETITHLAFYAGWPNAMSALAVAKEVFAKRAEDL